MTDLNLWSEHEGSKAGSENEAGSEQNESEAGSVTPSAPPAELVEVNKHSVKGQTCLLYNLYHMTLSTFCKKRALNSQKREEPPILNWKCSDNHLFVVSAYLSSIKGLPFKNHKGYGFFHRENVLFFKKVPFCLGELD